MKRFIILAATGLMLAGCGMNRAVGVLPNTLDDLAAMSKASSDTQGGETRRGQ